MTPSSQAVQEPTAIEDAEVLRIDGDDVILRLKVNGHWLDVRVHCPLRYAQQAPT